MIVQSIPQRGYATNNYKTLAAYVLRVPYAKAPPMQWGLSQDHQTDQVAWAKAVNSVSLNLGKAINETDLVQQMNKRAEACKTYHYVISFPAGEHPSREVLENIEDVLSTTIGYGAHQRLMAVHQDTPNLHMHVAINRVHPETFKVVGSAFDHYTLQRAAAELEDVHGLIKDSHAPGSRIRDREPFRPLWQTTEQPSPSRSPADKEAFKQARDAASQARKQALAALRAKHQAHYKKLVQWHAQRRANARAQRLSRADRMSTNLALREAAERDHAARKQKEGWERDAVKQQFPLLTWEVFTAQQAEREARIADERLNAARALHFSAARERSSSMPARAR